MEADTATPAPDTPVVERWVTVNGSTPLLRTVEAWVTLAHGQTLWGNADDDDGESYFEGTEAFESEIEAMEMAERVARARYQRLHDLSMRALAQAEVLRQQLSTRQAASRESDAPAD